MILKVVCPLPIEHREMPPRRATKRVVEWDENPFDTPAASKTSKHAAPAAAAPAAAAPAAAAPIDARAHTHTVDAYKMTEKGAADIMKQALSGLDDVDTSTLDCDSTINNYVGTRTKTWNDVDKRRFEHARTTFPDTWRDQCAAAWTAAAGKGKPATCPVTFASGFEFSPPNPHTADMDPVATAMAAKTLKDLSVEVQRFNSIISAQEADIISLKAEIAGLKYTMQMERDKHVKILSTTGHAILNVQRFINSLNPSLTELQTMYDDLTSVSSTTATAQSSTHTSAGSASTSTDSERPWLNCLFPEMSCLAKNSGTTSLLPFAWFPSYFV